MMILIELINKLSKCSNYYFNSMKTYSRVQKKGLMSSRNIQNNRLNSSAENFDELVQKQLEDDFKVHQYLNQNPNDGHNTEKYTSLFNSLLVRKNNKMKKKQLLKSSKAQLEGSESRCQDSQMMSRAELKNQKKDTYYSEQQYLKIKQESQAQQEIIQAQTDEQFQMRRILLKQITEKKKSIHLLKGDISHMIARNQSISVLQSKVNKVSLVSENQLKRVSLALTKDKEQVQLRKEMQRKFYNKLKIVQNIQNKNLNKIKLSFIDTMNRRKQIFQNLSLIQKQFESIEYYSDKLKQKEQKNVKTMALFQLLYSVCDAIDQSRLQWNRFENHQINHQEYSQLINKVFKINNFEGNPQHLNCFTIEDVTEQALQKICIKIIEQYKRLDHEVHENKKNYNNFMSGIEESRQKIFLNHRHIKQTIREFTLDKRKQLELQNFNLDEYFKTVNKLQSNYNLLYKLINFMNKNTVHFADMELVNQIYENEIFHFTIQTNMHHFKTDIDENLFMEIQSRIHDWFNRIKCNFAHFAKVPPQIKEEIIKFIVLKYNERVNSKLKQNSKPDKDSEEILKNNNNDILYEFTTSEQQNEDSQLNTYQKNCQPEIKTLSSLHSYKKPQAEDQVAKRVKILEDIDQSYYRMIKETIQMEKENTKKNYEFQKSFKRNKYSSQDELLEEKRFEASFSNLFKQDPDDSNNKPKDKNLQSKIAKVLSKSSKINKTSFSSMHNNNNHIAKPSEMTLKNNSGLVSTRGMSTHSNLWEKQKKLQLSVKLKDILSRV